MWDKVLKHLPEYQTGVLTGIDAEGYPYSLRCKPQIDTTQQILRISLPDYVTIKPGPASILCHYHNEKLWDLKNFVLRGTIEQSNSVWLFRPTQFIAGAGNYKGLFKLIQDGRRAAKQYLIKRNLNRPRIPWDKIKAIYNQAQKS
jgi:hypothetical protein